ncbi:glycosyltransferase [Xanthocytophaga agilis]|uniref:Glycosyltransferase n=1 Tax=Xanthocytophaga agilis TaxID=3048010 RepID=A0AAE3R8A7_9BACT|nr:nucleotide disphospho-sugar-binding domain-containing protein [Xanthocytophaga agilis]MDJ1503239.1 glycosyltransferase [Xanthocytophaga agilis]
MKARKILFATMPLDGHFNPLTSLAKHLLQQGHDVRWYTGNIFTEKLKKLEIPHYRFQKALEVNQHTIDELFPERHKYKSIVSKLKFDIDQVFVLRAPEYTADILKIYKEFEFEVLVYDNAFPAAQIIREKLHVPCVSMGIMPLAEFSVDLPPTGMGLTPSSSFWGRRKQDFLRFLATHVLFKHSTQQYNKVLAQFQIPPVKGTIFDIGVKQADLLLQSGVPGFEYKRSDMSAHVKFVGPLLPFQTGQNIGEFKYRELLKRYKKVILATQGTVERDAEKLLVPTLEAFKGTEYLLIVTTGGSKTQELRKRYPQENIVIEDFIDFTMVMPIADVYVSNGGYGGVLLSLQNRLPMVVAGVHEGKNEINARIGYFKLGINLKTETPTPRQVRESVEKVLSDNTYQKNVNQLGEEFGRYDTNVTCERYILNLITQHKNRHIASQALESMLSA